MIYSASTDGPLETCTSGQKLQDTVLKQIVKIGLHLMCSKLLPIVLLEFPRTFTYYSLCLAYYSKTILRKYTCIRNTSFKIVESNEVKSLVLAANH